MTKDMTTGKIMRTVVPRPTLLSIVETPPDCSANPCTIANPRPLPLPLSFVVKKGSNTRFNTSGSIPQPVSVTLTETYSPGSIWG